MCCSNDYNYNNYDQGCGCGNSGSSCGGNFEGGCGSSCGGNVDGGCGNHSGNCKCYCCCKKKETIMVPRTYTVTKCVPVEVERCECGWR